MANRWMTFGGASADGVDLQYAGAMGENGHMTESSAIWGPSSAFRMVVFASKIVRAKVKLSAAPGGGNSWNFRIMGGTNGTTVLTTITISGSDTEADVPLSLSYSNGHVCQVSLTASGSPAAARFDWGFEWESETETKGFVYSGYYAFFCVGTGINFISPDYLSPGTAFENRTEIVVPKDCVVRGLGGKLGGSAGTGESYTVTLRKNGVDTAHEVVLTNSTTFVQSINPGDAVSYAAGDKISLKVNRTSGATCTLMMPCLLMDFGSDDEFMTGVAHANSAGRRFRLYNHNLSSLTSDRLFSYVPWDVKLSKVAYQRTANNDTVFRYELRDSASTVIHDALFPINDTTPQLADVDLVVNGDDRYSVFLVRSSGTGGSGESTFSYLWSLDTTDPEPPEPVENWYNNDWEKRVKVTVQASQVSSDLTDFPVYVDLSALPAGFWANVKNGGGDIRVTTSDETTEIAREVVFCNTSTDTGELHFKAPSISSSVNTDFYIYFGNAAADDYAVGATYGRNNVWTDYAAVYHLQEDPTGSAPQMIDSTGNGNDLEAFGASHGSVTGKILQGVTLTNNGNYFEKGTPSSVANVNASQTISAWFNSDSTSGVQNAVVTSDDSGNIQYGYRGGNFGVTKGGGTFLVNSNTSYGTGTWFNSTYTYNGTTHTLYVNGSSVNTATTAPDTGTPTRITLGRFSAAWPEEWIGDLDEVRISKVSIVRAAAWVDAEHTNQNTPNTFFNYGSVEDKPDETITVDGLFYGGGI